MLKIRGVLGEIFSSLTSSFTKIPVMTNQLYRNVESLKPIEKSTPASRNDDLLLIKRIVKSYQYTASETERRGRSMWQDFFNQRHLPIHQIFKSGQMDAATAILRDPASSELFFGLDNLTVEIQPQIAKTAYSHSLVCLDSLIRFGEAIGAIGYYRPTEPWKAEIVVDKIEKTLGQKFFFPNPYPNEYGAWTPRGIISYRAPQALYQAWRIKQLVKDLEKPRVLEIGAGVGRTANFARQMGIEDYTIVDFPFTILSSGYFLGCTLGEDQILLPGETSNNSEKCVKFMTPEEYFVSDKKYDLIVNVDSITEMDPNVAQAYWNKIEANGKMFLSINHEDNPHHPFILKSMIEKSAHIEQYDRKPYWMRKRYFEEVIRFKH